MISQMLHPELNLSRCQLRRWRKGDQSALVRHASNYHIWRNVRDRFPYPYTENDAERWLAFTEQEEPPGSFAIVVDGVAVGGISLVPGYDIEARAAEIGYWLGETYWGRGIVSEAARALCAWAFANFDLCRIWAVVFARNAASARVLVKAGFTQEARLRQAITKEGKTMDGLLYALVRSDAPAQQL